MSIIDDLQTKLDDMVESHKEALKKAREEDTALTDQKIADSVKALEQKVEDYMNAVKRNNVSLDGVDEGKDKDRFQFSKAAYAILNGDDWKGAEYELEVIQETHKKAIDTNTGAQGAYLIPVELTIDKIIKPAIANTVMRDLGATFWEGLTSDIEIPEATSRPIMNWAADGVAASPQNIAFALQPLRPKTGNMLTQISNKLLKQQNVAERVVRELMMEGVTEGIDKITIVGTGTDSEPLGILNVSGTNTTNISSARMTIDDVAGMIEDIEEQNFLKTGGGSMLTRPKVKGGLRRERVAQYSGDTGGMPIINPMMSDEKLENLTGVKIRTTTNVPDVSNLTKAVVGEWKEFLIGIWGGMRLKASDVAGTAFATNQTWLVIFADVDSRCQRPLAFDIASNVKTDF